MANLFNLNPELHSRNLGLQPSDCFHVVFLVQRSTGYLNVLPFIWHNDDVIDQHLEHDFVRDNCEESFES